MEQTNVSPELAAVLNAIVTALEELNETIELSEDPETIAAVIRAQEQINRGDVVWHD